MATKFDTAAVILLTNSNQQALMVGLPSLCFIWALSLEKWWKSIFFAKSIVTAESDVIDLIDWESIQID